MAGSGSNLAAQVAIQLKSAKWLTPTQSWLNAFMSTQKPTTSLNTIVSTASFRLLNADITTCLETTASACFPPDISNGTIRERRLQGPIVAQILDIEDISKSRWHQIEAIEALERGEGNKGREIVRVVPTEAGDDPGASLNSSGGPHKTLLQDARGVRVYGVELRTVEGISLGLNIGSKLLLSNVVIARGVALLEPTTTSLLGGKIAALDKDWKENRKAHLKAAIEASEQAAA
jgi:RecQ-mediated genome instability protein 1